MNFFKDTSGAGEDKESHGAKNDEDVTDLDFEEISDGELEEERTRGLLTCILITVCSNFMYMLNT